MQKQQVLRQIAEYLERTPVEDVLGEIGLLTVLCHWTPITQLTQMHLAKEVMEGRLSLEDAYEKIAGALPEDLASLFEDSQLQSELSDSEIIEYTKAIASLEGGADIWLKELWSIASSRTSFWQNPLPVEVVQLMNRLCFNAAEAESVYTPFPYSAQLAVEAKTYAEEVVYETNYASTFFAASALLQGVTLQKSDPIKAPRNTSGNALRKFPHVMMAPPFGQKYESVIDPYNRFQSTSGQSDVMNIEHGLAQCSGRMIALIPQGLMFRGGPDKYFRERLVKEGVLDAVIQLPGAIFSRTAIATSILVIDKNRNPDDPVLFYNADNKALVRSEGRPQRSIVHQWERIASDVLELKQNSYCASVNKFEIERQNYDLSINRYVLSAASVHVRSLEQTCALSDIAQLIRAQLLKEDSEPQGEPYLEIGVKDIASSGMIIKPEKQMLLSGRARDRAEQQRLQPGDILLAIKGNLGKVGLVGDDCGDNWVANQLFQVIRLKTRDKISKPEYLYRYLSSTLLQTYLQDQASGSSMPVLKTSDIKALPIPVPPIMEQQEVLETHQRIQQAYTQIANIEADINKLVSLHWNMPAE